MKVSIAMATYNGARFLKAQLQSFVEQTRLPDELIINDDCSTDETLAIVQNFAATAPFTVKLHRNVKNLGSCGNFNAALMRATGDLVFLSDQDDVWLPNKVEVVEKVFLEHAGLNVVLNDAWITDEFLNKIGETKLQKVRRLQLGDISFVTGCCMALRQKFLKCILPIPSGLKEHDRWIAYLSEIEGSKLIIEDRLQLFRRHGANTSNSVTSQVLKEQSWTEIYKKISNPGSTKKNYQYHKALLNEIQRHVNENSITVSMGGEKLIEVLSINLGFARWQAEVRSCPRRLRIGRILNELISKKHRSNYRIRNAVLDCIVPKE